MLPRIAPINPTRIAAPFDHQDWFFELKHDGFRALAYIEDGSCRLISRKQIQYKSFATLSAAMAALPVSDAILDGELVCLDASGRSQFAPMMRRRQDVSFYAFDLLWCNGEDLRPLPLVERKRRLRRLIKGRAGLLFAEQIQGKGVELFEAICDRDLEGIVAKHRLGPYEQTPVTWFKVLNPDYSQKRGRVRCPTSSASARDAIHCNQQRLERNARIVHHLNVRQMKFHVLMSLGNADDECFRTRIKSGQFSSSCKHRSRSDIRRVIKTYQGL